MRRKPIYVFFILWIFILLGWSNKGFSELLNPRSGIDTTIEEERDTAIEREIDTAIEEAIEREVDTTIEEERDLFATDSNDAGDTCDSCQELAFSSLPSIQSSEFAEVSTSGGLSLASTVPSAQSTGELQRSTFKNNGISLPEEFYTMSASFDTTDCCGSCGDCINLGEVLFIYTTSTSFDHDGDGLKDTFEYSIAERFKPLLVFDSDEGATLPGEPVTLFQVHPVGCIGEGCENTTYRIGVKYVFLWRWDGGYGPDSGGFCINDHPGDNQGFDIYLSSSNGQCWHFEKIADSHFPWPNTQLNTLNCINYPYRKACYRYEFVLQSHPVLYLSAHKHHFYPNTAYNHDDSDYTDYGCNEDVNGKGMRKWPDLYSSRPNNVGESGVHHYDSILDYAKDFNGELGIHAHPPEYFVTDLSSLGFPGENAWSYKRFTGGLTGNPLIDALILDWSENSCLRAMWMDQEFHFSESFSSLYRPKCPIRGYVVDQGISYAKPKPGTKLYIRNVNPLCVAFGGCRGPWEEIPLDETGFFEIFLLESLYMLRPASGGYDFYESPIVVSNIIQADADYCPEAGAVFLGEETPPATNYVISAVENPTPVISGGNQPAISIVEVPTPVISGGDQPAISIVEVPTPVISSGDPPDIQVSVDNTSKILHNNMEELIKGHILTIHEPNLILSPDPKGEVFDDLIGLPTEATILAEVMCVQSRFGEEGTPAESILSVKMIKPKDTSLQPIAPPALCGPVAGAKVRARLMAGKDLVQPESTAWVEATTNSEGIASWTIKPGIHPGWTAVMVQITENPANEWALFSAVSDHITIHPSIHGDDFDDSLKVRLEKTKTCFIGEMPSSDELKLGKVLGPELFEETDSDGSMDDTEGLNNPETYGDLYNRVIYEGLNNPEVHGDLYDRVIYGSLNNPEVYDGGLYGMGPYSWRNPAGVYGGPGMGVYGGLSAGVYGGLNVTGLYGSLYRGSGSWFDSAIFSGSYGVAGISGLYNPIGIGSPYYQIQPTGGLSYQASFMQNAPLLGISSTYNQLFPNLLIPFASNSTSPFIIF